MSWQATSVVDDLPYDLVRPLAFRVLLKLANVANPEGRNAWRSKHELANELGVDARSIQRALRELDEANLIRLGDQKFVSHIRGGYRPTVYDIVMHRPAQGGIQPLEDGLSASSEDAEGRGDRVIHSPLRGDTRGDTDSSTKRTKELLNHLEEESLVPAVSAHDAREAAHEIVRSRCAPPFRTHVYRDHDTPVYCDHGCGVRSDGLALDPKTAEEIAPPRLEQVTHA